jgi:hypothetical protein
MAYIFQTIAAGKPANINENTRTQSSRKWFRDTAAAITGKITPEDMMAGAEPFSVFEALSIKSIGKMYCFVYDAKHKNKLPYWDKFPLVFPIEFYNDGFLGINLHYLPRQERAILMDSLYSLTSNKKMDSSTILRVSYEILSRSSRFKLFQPCVKRYLVQHVRSRFMYINPKYWDMALMLPSEQFVGASLSQVHKDSLKKVRR